MVSVIIPCHNCEAFIKRAIESALNQTYQDTEILLVNNHSTDGTMQILLDYQASFPKKIKVYQENKKGAPAARNHGLFKAKGEWIQFLDADDELLPEKIEKQLSIALREESDLVAGNCIVEIAKGGKVNRTIRHIDKDHNPWKGLLTSALGITSSILLRRKKVVDVGGWDETLSSSQEYDLLFRLLMADIKVAFDTSLMTVIYKMDNSISKSTDHEKFASILDTRISLRIRIKDYLKNTNRLTCYMRREADMYIYNELNTNYWRIPSYVNSYLKNNKLDVPLTKVLKTKAKLALKEYLSIRV